MLHLALSDIDDFRQISFSRLFGRRVLTILYVLSRRSRLRSFHLKTSVRSDLFHNIDWLLCLVHFGRTQGSNLSVFLRVVAFPQLLSQVISSYLRLLDGWSQQLLGSSFLFQSLHSSSVWIAVTLGRFLFISSISSKSS